MQEAPTNMGNPAKEDDSKQTKKDQFLVLLCDHGEKWTKHNDIFQQSLFPESEQVTIHVSKDEPLPDYSKLSGYKALVLSGSTYNLEDGEDWMEDMEKWIRGYYEYSKTTYAPKMLGICFGHQLLNKTFGGSCGPNKKHPEFSFGVNAVVLDDEFRSKPWAKDCPLSVQLYKCHGNAVNTPAKEAKVYGSSTQTDNEILIYGDQIFSLQPHPEMTPFMMKDVLTASLYEKHKITGHKKNAVEDEFTNNPTDTPFFRKVILGFMLEHVDKFGQPKTDSPSSAN